MMAGEAYVVSVLFLLAYALYTVIIPESCPV